MNCDLLCWELRLPSFHFFSLSFSVSCHGGQNSEIIKQKRNDPKERETRPDYVSKHHLPNQAEIVIWKLNLYTELAKKVCPRLRDLATAPAGGITQPRTNIFGQLCPKVCGIENLIESGIFSPISKYRVV